MPAPAQGRAAIDPDAVCTSQAARVITLFGEGLSPLPTKVLEDSPQLILPEVTLQQSESIDGQVSTADAFVVPDDPADPANSKVRWISQGELRFTLDSEMSLSPGLYSIRVKNGNEHLAHWENALLIVPPPQVTSIAPEAVCEAKDTEVELSGDFFLRKGESTPQVTIRDADGDVLQLEATRMDDCRGLPGDGGYEACKTLVVTVPKGALAPGTYTVVLQNPDPVGCESETTISLEVVPLPTITAVEPTKMCAGGGSLNITGTGFHPQATVTLGGVSAASVTVESETKITATFDSGLPIDQGALDVTVQNPGGCDATEQAAVAIVDGPQLFFADPPVVYNGISTQVTLFGSGISAVQSVGIRPAGSTDAPTILNHTYDALSPSRVQVVIPEGTAPGTYDVLLEDSTVPECEAVLAGGLTVVTQVTLALEDLDPPFGHTAAATPVTAFADAATAGGFQPLPRLYLNPVAGVGNAAPLQAVTFVDSSRATAIVPAGLPVGSYDLIAVNPDGGVGLLEDAFEVTAEAPPLVDSISPGSIPNRDGEAVTISGENFRSPVVTLSCLDGATGTVLPDITPAVTGSTGASVDLTVDAGGLGAVVCVVRVENSDGTYGDYSSLVVTNPAQNLTDFTAGPAMNMARRGLGGAASAATRAARFVYAIAGDDGAGGFHDTVEVAPVDVFGRPGTFFLQQQRLAAGRTRAGVASLGRCLYVAGGAGANGPLATVERACVLDPEERPEIVDLTLRKVNQGGLGAGVWYYRVSALLPANHPQNPGGETLTSEPFPLLLPDLGDDLLEVTLSWSTLPGATAYRIYRSPTADAAADALELLAEVAGTESSTVDAGGKTDSARVPLRFGATGVWHVVGTMRNGGDTADMPREAPGVAIAPDPVAADTYYLYVIGGKTNATTAIASFHRATITIEADGTQTVSAPVVGNSAMGAARHQLAAYSVGNAEASFVAAPLHLIYAGGGLDGDDNTVNDVDAFEVQAGGDLLRSTANIDSMTPARAGYGYAAANNFLFAFGGQQGGPDAGATAAQICEVGGSGQCSLGPPRLVNWNTATSLGVARYLMGSALQSGFIYILGGETLADAASTSTEYVIW